MRKFFLITAIAASLFATGCATTNTVYKASDNNVIKTVTGKVVSIKTKRRSSLTATNMAAGTISNTQGSSALGIAAFAIDILDHRASKERENYVEVKLVNEITGQEETVITTLPTLPQYAAPGDRVRIILTKYGGEAAYNLTRNPQYDELTR